MVWSSCRQKQGPYIVCRLDGSIYTHVLKYSCSEVSCGLQHWHNIGKPNTFLSLIWNGFGLAPLPIKAFGHFVERSEGGFCESSRRSPAWGVEGGLARASRCAPALAPRRNSLKWHLRKGGGLRWSCRRGLLLAPVQQRAATTMTRQSCSEGLNR